MHRDDVPHLRRAEAADRPFLIEMARFACTLADRPLPSPSDPDVLATLPGEADGALVACDSSQQPVGAAWWHVHEPPLLRDADGRTLPEMVMAVVEHARGRGVGTRLIEALIGEAARHHRLLTLNVHLLNPAVRLYVRSGFRVAGAGRGWYGVAMSRSLPAMPTDAACSESPG
jgi:GNAT superfamily N-acetyltransferase